MLRSSIRDVARLLLRSNWLFSEGLDGEDPSIDPLLEMDNRIRDVRFRLSPPFPATMVVVTTFIGRSRCTSWNALVSMSVGAVFLLDTGLDFFSVPGGEVLDVFDEFRDLFLGSAGECMKVSVVGVKRAVGTGGGEAGMGGSASPAGFDLYEGAADDALDGSRDSGALGLDVRELAVELVRHLSFHLRSVFLIPVFSVEKPVGCEAVLKCDMLRVPSRPHYTMYTPGSLVGSGRVEPSESETAVVGAIVHAMEQKGNSTWEGQRTGTHPLLSQNDASQAQRARRIGLTLGEAGNGSLQRRPCRGAWWWLDSSNASGRF